MPDSKMVEAGHGPTTSSVSAGNEMKSLAKSLDRLEHAFGLLREREMELDFAQLDQLSPEERRERIVLLSTKIAKCRGSRQSQASGSKMRSSAR
jgi:hypothetical protein